MQTLLDRIFLAMKETGAPVSAGDLGRQFLKIHGGGSQVGQLIRRLLGPDARFREVSDDLWMAAPQTRRSLDQEQYLLICPQTSDPSPERWILRCGIHAGSLAEAGPGSAGMVWELRAGEPADWDRLRSLVPPCRMVSLQTGAAGRALLWAERRWALPEWDTGIVDLQAWIRAALREDGLTASDCLHAGRLPDLFARWSLGPYREDDGGPAFESIRLVLERLLERHGSMTEEELREAQERATPTRPIDWSHFLFTRQEIEAIGAVSGTYRFFDQAGGILYVGKSADLSRRVRSYFAPVPVDGSRRARMMQEVRRFEVHPTPSELEALIVEGRAIRAHRPPWNAQVEVHPPESFPEGWWWPLVFVAGGNDPQMVSAFLLEDPGKGRLFHLPRTRHDGLLDALAHRFEELLTGGPSAEDVRAPVAGEPGREGRPDPEATGEDPGRAKLPGELELEPADIVLALRFFLRERDRFGRLDTVHFSSGYSMAEGLLLLAEGAGDAVAGNSGGWDQRPSSRSAGSASRGVEPPEPVTAPGGKLQT